MRILMATSETATRERWTWALINHEILSAGDLESARQALHIHHPTMMILDRNLAGIHDEIEVANLIRSAAETAIVVATPVPTAAEGLLFLSAGAKGYCSRLLRSEQLQDIILAIMRGELWAGRHIMSLLSQNLMRSTNVDGGRERLQRQFLSLTDRELQMVEKLAQGLDNKEIALALGISERTVKSHLSAVFRKLEVTDRWTVAIRVKAFFAGVDAISPLSPAEPPNQAL